MKKTDKIFSLNLSFFNAIKKSVAFTLAEVLIVLGIIGIIASLTIPSLVQEIQNIQLKTAWKHDYGMIEQATRRVLLDAGGDFKGYFTSSDNLMNKYLQYLTYTKKCSHPTSNGNCWHNQGTFKFLNGQPNNELGSTSGTVLNDGTLMWISFTNSTCTSIYKCGTMAIDVNGWNGPNTVGKDIFTVTVFEDSLKPYGATGGLSSELSCVSTSSGYGCSSKYLHE